MEGGRSAIIGAQPRGQIDADVSDADESARLWSGTVWKPRRRTSGYGYVGDRESDRRARQRRSVQRRFEQPCDELSSDDGSGGCREASGALQLRFCDAQPVATDDLRLRKIPTLTMAELVNEAGFVHS